jgi:hypothetical protein
MVSLNPIAHLPENVGDVERNTCRGVMKRSFKNLYSLHEGAKALRHNAAHYMK